MSSILIISPEPWTGHFVSKHHYALELALRGHDVLFFGPPEAGNTWIESVSPDHPQNLRLLHAPRVVPGLRYLPAFIRRRLETRWLRAVEQLAETRFDIIWLFENSRFFDMHFAGDRLKIYHQVDLNQDFHPEIAAATSDLSIAISEPIETRIKQASKSLLRITHGCALKNFAGTEERVSEDKANDIAKTFGRFPVNAVLTGNLTIPYLDQDLIAELVKRHPSVGFHFVGKYATDYGLHKFLSSAGNAIFWGQQPAQDLPVYLGQANILLVAYRTQGSLDQLANPHKIMEYLAAGTCILATRTLEYEGRPGLVNMATDSDDFLHQFSEIIKNLQEQNSPEQVAIRRAFAADNSYSLQLDRIAAALGSQGWLIS